MYKIYRPSGVLANYVRYFWTYEGDFRNSQGVKVHSYADLYPRLIFQNDHFDPVQSSDGELLPQVYLSGLDTRPSSYTWGSSFAHFGVSFQPHGLAALLPVHAADLVNQLPSAQTILNTKVMDKLCMARGVEEKINVLSIYFNEQLIKHNPDPLIHHLIIHRHIFNHKIALPQIQKKYCISERQLERKFHNTVGISPNLYRRILRFEYILSHIQKGHSRSLTDMAYCAGYFDQSHFIKDFKAFAGCSPHQFETSQPLGAESASFIFAR